VVQAYISIFYFFSSVFLMTKEWKNIDREVILKLAITSVIGVIIGILVLTFSKPIILKRGLGVFVLLYVTYVLWGKKKIKLNKTGFVSFELWLVFFQVFFYWRSSLLFAIKLNKLLDH
jgi:hypothetical protein